MGGRGAFAGKSNAQMDMRTYLQRQEIEHILLRHRKKEMESEVAKEKLNGSYGGATEKKSNQKQCRCCLRYSLPSDSEYEVCTICGWIDDPNQNANPDLEVGSNPISLNEARHRWQASYGSM